MRCRAPEVLLSGPAGTGKSRGCLEKVHLGASNYPKARLAIVRKTRKSLTQSAMVTFEEKVLPAGAPVRFHEQDQEYRYGNGSRIIVGGLDDPEKIKSTEFDLIYVQEATELNQADWEMLTSRLRNGVMPYQQIIADCNPADPGHWLKQRCDTGSCLMLESRHEDNPALTPEYLATLDRLTGYLYKRLRLGLWVAAEGMYFTEWDPDIHVVRPFEIPAHWTRWISVDYGFADPFCALWFARSPEQGRPIYVYRELYAPKLRDEQQAALILERMGQERVQRVVLDPSMFNRRTEQEKPSIAAVYARVLAPRLPAEAIVPGMNDRHSGWTTVRNAMAHDEGPPRLRVVGVHCPNLLRTLPAMVHDPLDAEDLADKVGGVKTEDHAVDALRYGLVLEATRPEAGPVKMKVGGR